VPQVTIWCPLGKLDLRHKLRLLIKHLSRINDDLFQLCKLLNEKQKSDFHRA